MSTSTAGILLPTARTRSRGAVASRAGRRARAETPVGELVVTTVGGYVSGSRSHSADMNVEGGYVTATVYATAADRIRGSYVSTGTGAPRSNGQGSYVTV
ncbi:hypothetical protein [Agreia sp. COWG]|uniref:hypothetical protein n=1 Tax=Agreia sp. COWG TaxID=2773266 RepID=UPI0019282CAE|nr:hypothetical protein [Agreia sp. COWG]CAD6010502.1 conserved protein of unknown function [Agreia sp. COWG]